VKRQKILADITIKMLDCGDYHDCPEYKELKA